MKKYERITLPIYRPWDFEKFRARPARWRGERSAKYELEGREQRHETCQNSDLSPSIVGPGTWKKPELSHLWT